MCSRNDQNIQINFLPDAANKVFRITYSRDLVQPPDNVQLNFFQIPGVPIIDTNFGSFPVINPAVAFQTPVNQSLPKIGQFAAASNPDLVEQVLETYVWTPPSGESGFIFNDPMVQTVPTTIGGPAFSLEIAEISGIDVPQVAAGGLKPITEIQNNILFH